MAHRQALPRTQASVLARSLALAALLMALPGCALGPTRHTPGARLDSHLIQDARRADALGLTPTAALSTAPVSIGDLAIALSANTPSGGKSAARSSSPAS